ncbi:MAG: hypothetical protein QOF73_2686 [Thermomicrobiales bacterium]|nr:hypothetical protein [Thermomicrobiales bacterium]
MPIRPAKPQTGMSTIGGQLVLSERLAAFKRVYRWLNLTLVHQATWPLLLLLTSAPAVDPELTPMPWYLARVGAPIAAALLALAYLRQRPLGAAFTLSPSLQEPEKGRRSAVAQQARFLLLGLPVMVAVVRLAVGPVEPAAKLMLFGLADVAAYHLIHFGVVARSYPDWAQGMGAATLLFAVSWGMHDALLTALGPSEASPALALVGGFVIGLAIALLSRAVRRWPGGLLPAAATHWLLIYLIFGFAG